MADEGQNPLGDGAQPPVAPKTFTQDEVNRLIGERLERERTKYADYDSLKKAADELNSIKQSQMSEAEKVAAAIKDRDTRLAALEKEKKDAEDRATALVRQTKAISTATILGAYDPTDANFSAAVAGIDPASPTADADIKAALDALKAAKPYLFKPAGAQPLASFNPSSGTGPAETDAQRVHRLQRQMGGGHGFGPLG